MHGREILNLTMRFGLINQRFIFTLGYEHLIGLIPS